MHSFCNLIIFKQGVIEFHLIPQFESISQNLPGPSLPPARSIMADENEHEAPLLNFDPNEVDPAEAAQAKEAYAEDDEEHRRGHDGGVQCHQQ
jgi:hypothetical protein